MLLYFLIDRLRAALPHRKLNILSTHLRIDLFTAAMHFHHHQQFHAICHLRNHTFNGPKTF